jgi:hypothetical protein
MKKISLLLLLLIGSSTFAQNLTFYGLLPAINQTGRINSKFNYNFFASTTIDAFREKVNSVEHPATDFQLYIQPSIIYVASTKFNLAASYTYQRNNPFNGNFTNEHRIWQQAIYAIPLTNGRITNRFRFEERFIQNKITQKYPISTRIRYQIGYNRPLKGKTLDKGEFYFTTYNEFYLSLTGAKNATYSENWSYAGFGLELGKVGKVELGYLFQVLVRNSKQDLRYLNLCQISWITNFNKKKSDK